MPVPKNEISHLLSARSKCNEVSEGMWARVKNGKYKGDLAQVVFSSGLSCFLATFSTYFLIFNFVCRLWL